MRPSILDALFAPVRSLTGVGPRLAAAFDRLLDRKDARVIDLLLHLPHDVADRRASPSIAAAPIEGPASFLGRVETHRPPQTPRQPYRVVVGDDTGDVTIVFFKMTPRQVERMLPHGAERYVSGRMELYDGRRQMAHPERILPVEAAANAAFEPIYRQTEGLGHRQIHRFAIAGLERLPALPEWIEPALRAREAWPDFGAALASLHRPDSPLALSDEAAALRRLAYDEMLASQIALHLVRGRLRTAKMRPNAVGDAPSPALRAALPFAPTGAQERAIRQIHADLASGERMVRLLQGDVGAGKTLVAAFAIADAGAAGRQSALMAPTEILARQHFDRLGPLLARIGVGVELLTGRMKAAERKAALERLADGRAGVAIGTHALFQDEVAFADLGLAVVDEQHRFGVHQRLALSAKGAGADLLVMTATPIPRTLALSLYGDMEVSVLDEKPPGRRPIDTRVVPLDRIDAVIGASERAIAAGARIYWICPLVEDSEHAELSSAEARFADLEARFPGRVGLVHGRLGSDAKEAALSDFAAGRTAILVATTVVEVGVDVPAASVMVIEHAERFGLAQLHQLRGRVGRGAAQSRCLLLYAAPLGPTAEARLRILRETEDGFRIAEEDLRLRGSGDLLGSAQSGMPGFRIARLGAHAGLLATARDDARLILQRDPDLTSERGQALRLLLHLFERHEAVGLLRAG